MVKQKLKNSIEQHLFCTAALVFTDNLERVHLYKVMRCWCGYMSGARCSLIAYGPADTTASQNSIVSCLI